MGRPIRTAITVSNAGDRGFRVEVPRTLGNGKRIQKFFRDRCDAELWAAQRHVEFLKDGEIDAGARTKGKEHGIKAAVALYLADRKGDVCQDQLKLYRIHLGKLSAKFGHLGMGALSALDARRWLRGIECAQRTRHGIFSSCRTFYRWANRYDYTPANPFEKMEFIPKGEATKEILTPAEMRALLESKMPDYLRAWLVLGGFCGLRPIEVTRSDWAAVNFETREFHVSPDASKRDKLRGRGVRERYVAIPETALRLIPHGLAGPSIPVAANTLQSHVRQLAVILAKMRGEPTGKRKIVAHGRIRFVDTANWPHDCLRHSAASYMLAIKEDAGWVAYWLGHTTTKTVYENYARAVPKAAAVEWWGIAD